MQRRLHQPPHLSSKQPIPEEPTVPEQPSAPPATRTSKAPKKTMRSPARSPVANPRGRPFDRHSATGTRGLPKKKGAGGKGVWGAEMDQQPVAFLDKNDPNYDSDNDAPPQLELGSSANAPASATDTDAKDAKKEA